MSFAVVESRVVGSSSLANSEVAGRSDGCFCESLPLLLAWFRKAGVSQGLR